MSDFWDKFTVALVSSGENRPKGTGWKTPSELALRWKMCVRRAGCRLMAGVKAGLLEYYDGNVYKDGKLRRCRWYREKKK